MSTRFKSSKLIKVEPKKKSIRFSVEAVALPFSTSNFEVIYPQGVVFAATPHVMYSVVSKQKVTVNLTSIEELGMQLDIENLNEEESRVIINFILHYKD